MTQIVKKLKMQISDALTHILYMILRRRGRVFRYLKAAILKDELIQSLTQDKRIFNQLASNENFLTQLTQDDTALCRLSDNELIARAVDFEKIRSETFNALNLEHGISEHSHLSQRILYARNKLKLEDAVLNCVSEENYFYFNEKKIKYSDRNSLWILINEILINEDYFFVSENTNPMIIDGGCHFGLATLYLKSLFPDSKVFAFEPIPEFFDVAKENFEAFGLENVELLPYALSNEEKSSVFYVSENNPMGSSLEDRFERAKDTVVPIEVQCKKLSEYLVGPVDFLKLDIEGAEHVVLKEAKNSLKNVHFIFVEVHIIDRETNHRLNPLISILEENGFDVHCSKSWTSHLRSEKRPLNFVGEPLTHVIWGKNRHFEPA